MSAGRSLHEREAAQEAKVLAVIRGRLQEARRSRAIGKLIFEVQLHLGGPTHIYTEIDTKYKILED